MKVDKTNIIEIVKKDNKKDSYGQPTSTWEVIARAYASKEPILGNEYFSAKAIQSKVEVKFKINYLLGITNEMRIIDNEGIYEILSVINIKNQNRELLMYCKKVD